MVEPIGRSGTAGARRARWTLPVLCAAVFLNALDSSIVAIALPTIQRQLQLSTATLQWVVSGFALGYAGFLLVGGRVADVAGRRRVLLAAVAAFAGAATLAGLAGASAALIAARIAAGTSLAFVVPTSLAILAQAYPEGSARSRAFGIYAAVGAGGWTAGLLLGGLLTAASWRLVFLAQVPIALVILSVTPSAVAPDSRRRAARPDIPGAILGTLALLALVYTLSRLANRSLASWVTVAAVVTLALLVGLFLVVERRAVEPLVPPDLIRSRAVWTANLVAFAYFGSYSGFLFLSTLYLQRVLGWSPLSTALAFLPAAMLATVLSTFAGRSIQRFGRPPVLLVGMLTMLAAYVLLVRVGLSSSYAVTVLPTVVLVGVGAAIAFPSISDAGLAGAPADRHGLVGGLLNTSMQTGAGCVLALVSAAVTVRVGPGQPGDRVLLLAGYRLGLWITVAVAALGALAVVLGALRPSARRPEPAVSGR